MQAELTTKQQRFLEYLGEQIERTGSAPSLRQAAADLGISHMAVSQFVRALEVKGYIKRGGRYSRGLSLVKEQEMTRSVEGKRFHEVPIVGRIAAGLPLYAQQEWDGSIIVDGGVFKGHQLFALRVKGDSMQDAGILDGDLIICEPRQYAANGEIVVALLVENEEATVKRFFLLENEIELRPENREKGYAPKRYGFGAVLVQGKVIGVQRGPDRM
ncbi:MAG: repressor LexA [Deltaproteobacteria bacterium RIFOXYD12_FULL_50_9]|nr:MAG: repressor LexA [Deltaproteobacteria bacterium RIFOXYD12_FULL_50_9]